MVRASKTSTKEFILFFMLAVSMSLKIPKKKLENISIVDHNCARIEIVYTEHRVIELFKRKFQKILENI